MSPSRYEQAVRASLAERGLCVVFQVVTQERLLVLMRTYNVSIHREECNESAQT
jgi:hypothetical protein